MTVSLPGQAYLAPADLLQDRIILVTGASAGIGREAALSYARHGAQLILLGRDGTRLETLAQQIVAEGAPRPHLIRCDLLTLNEAQSRALVADLGQRVDRLDGLLHSAGLLGDIAPLAQQDYDQWQAVMQVNVNAQFLLTRDLLPLLQRAPRASLIFTSSSVGRQGRAGWGAYAVSKFATEGMMQVWAEELAASSVRVNAINPGATRTAMRASAYPDEDPHTLLTPAQIMPLYLYLMGDDSQNVHGRSLDAQPGRRPGRAG
ncbi:YciK family oxidoreductase [Edwardsiella tarda]|uniref:YciK family oxidoreductase n=2 Tax=Edwardsiella tarda TaxID=636 RepID=A0A2A7U3Q8_EDWTA|nr:YciK family oxidoreductase [Edwardsiella tarda]AKH89291.1 YciK family oxidoreductase [Edwardsiella tarda]EFE23249.1 oxidoreductase, short chain dehydrogenase/reductase family protein [Edwardsiella tarda ATCC 23685]PEH72911.1 YciK family oxidoreductase [Edwardsiella tarda]UCQ26369.1 YciK family oxidoreductase [Edwardsiella tarda]UCQ52982.1 YciK family oxidoreductase [Edwardsiella tarda]